VKPRVPLILLAFFFGLPLIAEADPLDASSTVYIDGVACNIACQSYMAWSQRVLEGSGQLPPRRAPSNVVPPDPGTRAIEPSYHAAPRASSNTDRDGKKFAIVRRPLSAPVPRRNPPGALGRGETGKIRTTSSPLVPSPQVSFPQVPSARNASDGKTSTTKATKDTGDIRDDASNQPSIPLASKDQTVSESDTKQDRLALHNREEAGRSRGDISATPPAPRASPEVAEAKQEQDSAARQVTPATVGSPSLALEHQIQAAAAVAEQFTLAAMDTVHASDNLPSNDATSGDKFQLIALVLARSEIRSVADLAGNDVAVDGRHLGSDREVRTALVAAGASAIRIRDEGSNAVKRLVEGQVPAAVLTLVSQDAANAFPNIAGFNLFEIPLSPPEVRGKPASH
jgi:hypothetical protein